jgi:type II secretory pathway predicted ATPase ExeA
MSTGRLHLDFFGLREQPFAPTADPSYFCATRDHKACLFRVWNSIDERHGIAVILGSYGTGKTTLLRKLMSGMAADPEKYNTAVLGSPIPSWTSFSLLEAIVNQFQLRPADRTFGAYMQALNEYLLANRNRISTLIIDDAQNLNKRGQLELLRLAQNLETPQHKLLNLVCFAQLEWTRVLEAAPNFLQRINVVYTLSAFSVDDLREMIQFRLKQAGAAGDRAPEFDDASVRMIHGYSEGNPRVIVSLCRNSLLLAAQLEQRRITADMVLHTIEKTTTPNPQRLALAAASSRPSVAQANVAEPTETVEAVGAEAVVAAASAPARANIRQFGQRANQLLMQASRTRHQ